MIQFKGCGEVRTTQVQSVACHREASTHALNKTKCEKCLEDHTGALWNIQKKNIYFLFVYIN